MNKIKHYLLYKDYQKAYIYRKWLEGAIGLTTSLPEKLSTGDYQLSFSTNTAVSAIDQELILNEAKPDGSVFNQVVEC